MVYDRSDLESGELLVAAYQTTRNIQSPYARLN